jgi:hypothetical protein
MGEKRNTYRVLVGKPEGKRPVGRPRFRWEDNIKMDLRETGGGGMECIDLAQNGVPVAASYEYGNEPSDSIKCWDILE